MILIISGCSRISDLIVINTSDKPIEILRPDTKSKWEVDAHSQHAISGIVFVPALTYDLNRLRVARQGQPPVPLNLGLRKVGSVANPDEQRIEFVGPGLILDVE